MRGEVCVGDEDVGGGGDIGEEVFGDVALEEVAVDDYGFSAEDLDLGWSAC